MRLPRLSPDESHIQSHLIAWHSLLDTRLLSQHANSVLAVIVFGQALVIAPYDVRDNN